MGGQDSQQGGSCLDPDTFQDVHVQLDVAVEPSDSVGIKRTVNAHVGGLLLKYSESFGGVPLGFSDLVIQERSDALLHPYHAYLQLHAAVNLTVFCPKKGMRLVGIVQKVTQDMLGLSVLGVFPAVVKKKSISRALKMNPKKRAWISSKDPSYVIETGTPVVFSVDSLNVAGGIFSIIGSIQSLKMEGRYDKVLERGSRPKKKRKSGEVLATKKRVKA